MSKPTSYRFLPLPPDFNPVDAIVDEVASWRRESRWTVHKKIREGAYESYLDGRIRKIIFESVKADRERSLSATLKGGKRQTGRPRKPEPATAACKVETERIAAPVETERIGQSARKRAATTDKAESVA
jgi:hypothetical protein